MVYCNFMTIATSSWSKILKSNPIGNRLNGFCDSLNSTYEELDSKDNISQALVRILPNVSRAEKYLPCLVTYFPNFSGFSTSTFHHRGQKPP